MGGTLLNGWHDHTLTDTVHQQARETAEQVARREAERSLAWAQHVADALLLVEEAGDE